MRKENLLIELGTEELPPKALKQLGSSFANAFEAALKEAELEFASVHWYAAPRRLALAVEQLSDRQQDKVVEKRGPAVNVAFDADGNPTKAAQGWARGNGITVDEAQRLVTDKGEWLLYKADVAGEPIESLLSGLIQQALSKLPIPKPMRWGTSDTQFIRPVHTLCCLYGSDVIDSEVLGLRSDRLISGHRFHSEGLVSLAHADDYLATLKQHYVIADFNERCEVIAKGLAKQAQKLGLNADYDQGLLEEISSLVEWPVVLQAGFDESFLDVPKEALIYTMKDDQKYVPLLTQQGELSNTFLFVSNIESSDPSQVIGGNERVIRPRLADAEFFYNTDKKHTLESRLETLDSVLFQKQLGSLKEKSERISQLASTIAKQVGSDEQAAARAGLLSKCDLMTNMVMEFPDVQGVMGKYYAQHDGEQQVVADALYEQYFPRFAGDDLPSNDVSSAVALADKLDTLVGIFGIGQLPKGDKDPFALRRAAIGLLRIITERNYALDLVDLVDASIAIYGDKLSNQDTAQQVVDFILARLVVMLQDNQVDYDVVQAVAANRPTQPSDYLARVNAVAAFKQHESAESLAAANKRVANILAKNAVESDLQVDAALLDADEEKALNDALRAIERDLDTAINAQDYSKVLALLATLRQEVDNFFDNVMVMAEDQQVRNNRLALLQSLRSKFLVTADISLLVK